ncbi:MAG: SH3 domain-containing protein [Anaerolineales bacterium]
MTLTVAVTEILPTPTGFAEAIGRATPAAGEAFPQADVTLLPSELSGGSPFYAVILVSAENFLNVRAGPGVDQEILGTLESNATGIQLTGEQEQVGEDLWVEIDRGDEPSGWVSKLYLTQQVPKNAFCSNAHIRTLARDFIQAVAQNDNELFASLVNPERGLNVRQIWSGNEIFFSPEQATGLFTSNQSVDWGTGEGSGEDSVEGNATPEPGSFRKVILPELQDVISGDFTQACNTLEIGTATGGSQQFFWPYELSNLNYITLYRPAPEENRQDWRSWALGVEVINGTPYLTYLIQYTDGN